MFEMYSSMLDIEEGDSIQNIVMDKQGIIVDNIYVEIKENFA